MAKIRTKDWLYLFALLALGLFLTGWTIVAYVMLLINVRDIASIFVNVSTTILILFLVVLMMRYLLLLWASYRQHRESISFSDRERADFTPTVSVLVPAYNEGPGIEGAIQSLLDLDYPEYEVVVINDGSADDTFERAQKWAGRHERVNVVVLDTGRNVGKAEALNLGIARSRGEIVVCMDADSRLEPQSIRRGVAHFLDPEVSAVAGNVKVVNRNSMLTRMQALEYLEGLNLVRRAQGYFQCVNIIPGPMGFFRRHVLQEIGGYESDTFAEDCDLTVKLLSLNKRINYEPEAISWTEAPETIGGLITQRYRWTRGILQSIRKHKYDLFHVRRAGFINSIVLWYMLFEAIAWPMMNIFGNIFFLAVTAWYGAVHLLILWWMILLLLDMIAALHTVSMEEEELSLVFYSIPYRLFFIFAVDVAKMLSTLEEFFGVRMTWGHVERRGRIMQKETG